MLTWSEVCVMLCLTSANQATSLAIMNTKHFVPVAPFSTQDNTNLLQQLKSGFKGTVNWNKYQSKVTIERQNQYLNYLINPNFQGVKQDMTHQLEQNTHDTFFQL